MFTGAHAHNVMTLPSHVNILTGLYPYQHGVRDNEGFRLDPKIPTLASILKARGYATAAVIGAFPLDARFGLSHDFDLYDQRYPQGAHEYDFTVAERPASEVVAVARQWLGAHAGGPRFLWVHLYDCHSPYRPPPSLAADYPDAPYLGEVAGVDEALGPLFADLRASSRPTLVVVTADHGEALGEHGERRTACSPTRRRSTFRCSSGEPACREGRAAKPRATSTSLRRSSPPRAPRRRALCRAARSSAPESRTSPPTSRRSTRR